MSITIIELPTAKDIIKVATFALVVIESIRIRKAIKKALKEFED